jgi:hypothetical protein
LRALVPALVAALLLPAAGALADPGPALTIDASAGRHPISPYVYGWNFADPALAAQIELPVDRQGGNSADTLNWQTGYHNTSADYFFENLPWCWDTPYGYCSSTPADSEAHRAYTDRIDADRTARAQSLIDIPMLGYVPKPTVPAKQDHPFDCSFPKTAFAAQDSFDQFDTNCGNGKHDNVFVTNAPQTSDAVAADAAFQGGWVDDLKSRYGAADAGGVKFYELGNEPGLWNDTHHDWHPAPVSYDELWSKSQALALEVKTHDPGAQTLAFSEWGWPNYFCSSADNLADGCQAGDSDRANHGGKELSAWLLEQFKAWADTHAGQRLIDYFDLHYYRQDGGAAGTGATRSLWDPSYTDQSWIGTQIRMLPRMHDWVDQAYPGTKISLSEYDLAYSDARMDNLVQADVLGIFGRERLDLATLWPETSTDHYADAFRIYRNYDGSHSKFGDTYVSSRSADQGQLAVYGAERSGDGALTLVVINKTLTNLTSDVGLAGFGHAPDAQVWRWAGVDGGITRAPNQAVGASGFSATFPNRSITMFVIPPTGGSAGAPPPCLVPRLTGLTLKRAKARVRKTSCRLGKVTKAKSRRHRGTVIRQKPAPNPHRKLRSGTRIALVLSRGR